MPDGSSADREHGLLPWAERLVHPVDAGIVAEDARHRVRVAREHVRPVVVVHREHPAGLQVIAHRGHRFLREQEALEAQRSLPAHERERVGQREQDQVVRAIGSLEEGSTVVDVRGDARIVVRTRRVMRPTRVQDRRVDLHGVHALHAVRERERDVVAVARPDDQHVGGGLAEMRVRQRVELLTDALERQHRLVREGVHDEPDPGVVGSRGRHRDPVVGRPHVGGDDRAEREHEDHARRAHDLSPVRPTRAEREEQDADHESPRRRAEAQERHQRERDDAAEAADDVEPVGLEWREPLERSRHAFRDRGHREHRATEQQWERDPHRRRGQPGDGRQSLRVLRFHDPPDEHREGDARHDRGRPPPRISCATGAEEPDPDAEEAREQDEVREVRDVHLVRGHPPDQGELREEHQEAREHEAKPLAHDRSIAHAAPGAARRRSSASMKRSMSPSSTRWGSPIS